MPYRSRVPESSQRVELDSEAWRRETSPSNSMHVSHEAFEPLIHLALTADHLCSRTHLVAPSRRSQGNNDAITGNDPALAS